MYNEELATKILEILNRTFPRKATISDLRMSGDQLSVLLQEDWLTAVDALLKLGWVQGIPLRAGFQDVLEDAANLEITPAGRDELSRRTFMGGASNMKVIELKSKMQHFHDDMEEHFRLWCESLDQPLPDYPVRNVQELREQVNGLARQLGTLRPYIERLTQATTIGVMGLSWDAYDSAVSNDVAARKGPSIEAILPQVQQMIGRLESLNPEGDFPLESRAHPPMQTVNIYNLQGAHARVNIQSTDHSLNISSITEQQVFSGMRQAITQGVPDDGERQSILDKLDELQKASHSSDFLSKYQSFINTVASHMTIILPFIPALTQMLGR